MDMRPYCKICGKNHWFHEPHDFGNNSDKSVTNIPIYRDITNKKDKGKNERVLRWKKERRDKYNAYMREYMRKKRRAIDNENNNT